MDVHSLKHSCLLLLLLQYAACEVYEADVLVLGAGMTGISAARHLSQNLRHDHFIVIEGDHRIGGRVKDVQFGGKTVELGANWIHGTEGNPLFKLAKKYGLQMNIGFDYDDVIIRDQNGTDVTAAADKYYAQLDEAIINCEKIRKRKITNREPDVTYRSALSMSGWMPSNKLMDLIEYSYFDYEYAVSPEEISLKNGGFYTNYNYKSFKDEDAFVMDQRGFAYLIRKMASEFMDENDTRLHLSKVVSKIEYNNTGVKVTTKNGDVFLGKYAICTFSVGVLEHNVVEFVPDLPFWKKDVANNFAMSYYLKVFVKFPEGTERFWDEETFLYHSHNRRGYFPSIQNLEAKNLFDAGTNLLLITVTGLEAVRVTRAPKPQIIDELNEILRNLYGNSSVPIEDILIPTWIQDPLQFGMFSSWPLGVTKRTSDVLRQPVGRIFFAGEYTSEIYYGYIHGAYYEGIRAARQVFNCQNGVRCSPTVGDPQNAPQYYRM